MEGVIVSSRGGCGQRTKSVTKPSTALVVGIREAEEILKAIAPVRCCATSIVVQSPGGLQASNVDNDRSRDPTLNLCLERAAKLASSSTKRDTDRMLLIGQAHQHANNLAAPIFPL